MILNFLQVVEVYSMGPDRLKLKTPIGFRKISGTQLQVFEGFRWLWGLGVWAKAPRVSSFRGFRAFRVWV